jgi:hypothetical protein
MKVTTRWVVSALVIASIAASISFGAQKDSDSAQGTAPKKSTVVGTIEVIRDNGLDGCQLCLACSDCQGTHVLLRTQTGHLEVHLAPAWFLNRLEFVPSVGDVVRVAGSRTQMPNGRGLTADELHAGAVQFKLRDEHGLPLWRRMLTDTRDSRNSITGR